MRKSNSLKSENLTMTKTFLALSFWGIVLSGCKKTDMDKKNNTSFSFENQLNISFRHTTIANNNLDSLIKFINVLYEIKNDDGPPNESLLAIADSVYRSAGLSAIDYVTNVFDTSYIHAKDLLGNEKLAKKALLESSWKNAVSFEIFQEYILPYKLTDEIYDNWRSTLYLYHQELTSLHPALKDLDSLYQFHLSKTYYALDAGTKMQDYVPYGKNFKWLNISREGDCISRCKYVIYHLRAAGAPATFDYIPNWGNRPYALHAFVGLANKKQQLTSLLENTNNPKNLVDNLNAAMSPKHTPVFSPNDLPCNMYVQYEKTIPKVYRQTWNEQPEIVKLIGQNTPSEIDRQLIDPYMLDVTSQYLQTAKVKVRKRISSRHKIAYLATFDISGWTPVAYTNFNWFGEAVFEDMGKNILYMPMVCEHKMKPLGTPFILDNSGKKRALVCNYDKTIDMKLVRKFPIFSYTANHVINFKGCKIEGANDYRFRDATTLHTIADYPFGMQIIDLEVPDTVRYVHLISPEGETIRLAEMACYEDSCGIMKKLEDINFKKGLLKGHHANAFDGNLNSYMAGRWTRIDFGSSKPITRIKFCPRNDTNYVVPGNEYELLYWDGRWISAGRKTANDYCLNYKSVPSGTVYWLRCLTEGKEERIFTYDNDKQLWW